MDGLSREERRLMRQRGAGNRAGKAVDFGFSFGSPPPEPLPQRAKPPAQVASDAQPAVTASIDSEIRRQSPIAPLSSSGRNGLRHSLTPSRLTPVRKTPTPTKSRTRALNNFGESSPYDIPRDEETDRDTHRDGEQERSPKRRRTLRNGSQNVTRASLDRVSEDIEDSATAERQGGIGRNDTGRSTLSPMINVTTHSPPLNGSTSKENGNKVSQQETRNVAAETEDLPPVERRSSQPPNRHTPESAVIPDSESHPQSSTTNHEITEKNRQQRTNGAEDNIVDDDRVHEPISQSPIDEGEKETAQVEQDKAVGQSSVTIAQGEVPIDGDDSNEIRETVGDGTADSTDQVEEGPEITAPPADTAKRSRPGLRERVKSTVQNSVSRVVDKFRKRKRDGDSSKNKDPGQRGGKDTTPRAESTNETSTIREPSRQLRNQEQELRDGVQNARSDEKSKVPDRVETSAQPSKPKKSRRRPVNSDKDGNITKRLPAVPVTVHRLSNATALDSHNEDTEDTEEDDQQEKKRTSASRYTRRSGVNSVDILNQVCRETFDDVLSTLQENFASEGDKKRRADIVRRIKALQAFSTELEHRLFDIREVLDANYVLAAQLRREKRDVAILRAELLGLRRQRNEVALEMDEVRQSFMAEQEQASRRAALTNSMQELELALERSKVPSTDDDEMENPAAGLEFLLRSVADSVSSTAPDSRGGLLELVKTLNDRLEQIDTALERRST